MDTESPSEALDKCTWDALIFDLKVMFVYNGLTACLGASIDVSVQVGVDAVGHQGRRDWGLNDL